MKIGDRVAAPVCVTNPYRKPTRSKYSYDIGTIVALGRHKKTGKPAAKIRFVTQGSVWAYRMTKEPVYERWCFVKDLDLV